MSDKKKVEVIAPKCAATGDLKGTMGWNTFSERLVKARLKLMSETRTKYLSVECNL